MISSKKNLILFLYVLIAIFLPFLEFFEYNFNNNNGITNLKINFLTIKRLGFLYIIFILVFFSILYFFTKKSRLNIFDSTIYLSFIYWILFKYNEIKKIFDLEFFNFLSNYNGELSLAITLFIIIFFTKFYLKKKAKFLNIFISFFFILNFFYLIF